MRGARLGGGAAGRGQERRTQSSPPSLPCRAAYVSGATIVSSYPAGQDAYTEGDSITVRVTFSRAVDIAASDASNYFFVELTNGSAVKEAKAGNGGPSTTHDFTYVVEAGWEDADGLVVNADVLETGTAARLEDAAKVPASLTFSAINTNASNGKVDSTPPAVNSTAVAAPPNGQAYLVGEALTVTVTFSEPVAIAGTGAADYFYVELDNGSAVRQRAKAGDGGLSVTHAFTYVVEAGWSDGDGVVVLAGIQEEGTAATIRDGALLDSGLGFAQAGPEANGAVAAPPAVSSAALAAPPGGQTAYTLGDALKVTVTFSDPVTIAGTGAADYFYVELDNGSAVKRAVAADGGPSATHDFTYVVEAGWEDADGLVVNADLREEGAAATIRDGVNDQDVVPGFPQVGPDAANGKVDQTGPSVSGAAVSAPPSGQSAYKLGDALTVTVTFSEPVAIAGTGAADYFYVELDNGSVVKRAVAADGGPSTTHDFTYVVEAGWEDEDGVAVLDGVKEQGAAATIRDGVGLDAVLAMAQVGPDATNGRVDQTAPSVSGATVAPPPGGRTAYTLGDALEVIVTFSEPVAIAGTGAADYFYVELDNGGSLAKRAVAGDGGLSATHSFTYVVEAGWEDADGVVLHPGVKEQGTAATIRDGVGLGIGSLDFPQYGRQPNGIVDQTPPVVSGVALAPPPSGQDAHKRGDTLTVTVTFSEPVAVTGTDASSYLYLDVANSSLAKRAVAADGALSTTHAFTYVVEAGWEDADGVVVQGDVKKWGSAVAVRDGAGLDAVPTFTQVGPDATNGRVDQTPPTVTGAQVVAPPGGREMHRFGDTLRVAVTFSEPVSIAGTGEGSYSYVEVTNGVVAKRARAGAGALSATHEFAYVIEAGWGDEDGVVVEPGVRAEGQGAAILDGAGNPATAEGLAFARVAADALRGRVEPPPVVQLPGGPSWTLTMSSLDCLADEVLPGLAQEMARIEVVGGATVPVQELAGGAASYVPEPVGLCDSRAASDADPLWLIPDGIRVQITFGEPLTGPQLEALRATAATALSAPGLTFRDGAAARRRAVAEAGGPLETSAARLVLEASVDPDFAGRVTVAPGDALQRALADLPWAQNAAMRLADPITVVVDGTRPVPRLVPVATLLFDCDERFAVSLDFGEPMMATREQLERHIEAENLAWTLDAWDRGTGTGRISGTAVAEGTVTLRVKERGDDGGPEGEAGTLLRDVFMNRADAGAGAGSAGDEGDNRTLASLVALCERRPAAQGALVAAVTTAAVASTTTSLGAAGGAAGAGAAGVGSAGAAAAAASAVSCVGVMQRLGATAGLMPSSTSDSALDISSAMGEAFGGKIALPGDLAAVNSWLGFSGEDGGEVAPARRPRRLAEGGARGSGAFAAVSPWTDPSAREADYALAVANAQVPALRGRRGVPRALREAGLEEPSPPGDPGSWRISSLPAFYRNLISDPLRQLVLCGTLVLAVLAVRAAVTLSLMAAGRRALPEALEFPKPEAFLLLLLLPILCEAAGALFGSWLAIGSLPLFVGLLVVIMVVVPVLVLAMFLVVWAQAAGYARERPVYYLVAGPGTDRRTRDAVDPVHVRWSAWRSWLGVGRGRWNLPRGEWRFAPDHAGNAEPHLPSRPAGLGKALAPFSDIINQTVGPPVVRVGADYRLIPGVPRFNRGFLVAMPWGERPQAGDGAAAPLDTSERKALRRWVSLQYASLLAFMVRTTAVLVIVGSMAASKSASEAFGGAAQLWGSQVVTFLQGLSLAFVILVAPCEPPAPAPPRVPAPCHRSGVPGPGSAPA